MEYPIFLYHELGSLTEKKPVLMLEVAQNQELAKSFHTFHSNSILLLKANKFPNFYPRRNFNFLKKGF